MSRAAPKPVDAARPVAADPYWPIRARAAGWPEWQIVFLAHLAGSYVDLLGGSCRYRNRRGGTEQALKDPRAVEPGHHAAMSWALTESSAASTVARIEQRIAAGEPPVALEGDSVPAGTYGNCAGCGSSTIITVDGSKCAACGGWGPPGGPPAPVVVARPDAPKEVHAPETTTEPWPQEELSSLPAGLEVVITDTAAMVIMPGGEARVIVRGCDALPPSASPPTPRPATPSPATIVDSEAAATVAALPDETVSAPSQASEEAASDDAQSSTNISVVDALREAINVRDALRDADARAPYLGDHQQAASAEGALRDADGQIVSGLASDAAESATESAGGSPSEAGAASTGSDPSPQAESAPTWASAMLAAGWPPAQVDAILFYWRWIPEKDVTVEERVVLMHARAGTYKIARRDGFSEMAPPAAALMRAAQAALETAAPPPCAAEEFVRCAMCLEYGLERCGELAHPDTGKPVCEDCFEVRVAATETAQDVPAVAAPPPADPDGDATAHSPIPGAPQHDPSDPPRSAVGGLDDAVPEDSEPTAVAGAAADAPAQPQRVAARAPTDRYPKILALVDPDDGSPWAGLQAWTDASACYPKAGATDVPPAGIGVVFVRGDTEVKRVSAPIGGYVTYVAELRAMEVAIDRAPAGADLFVVSDNESAVLVLRGDRVARAADRLVERILGKVNRRLGSGARTFFAHVKGHSGYLWNELADYLAWLAVRKHRLHEKKDPTAAPVPKVGKRRSAGGRPGVVAATPPQPEAVQVQAPDPPTPDAPIQPLRPIHERRQMRMFR